MAIDRITITIEGDGSSATYEVLNPSLEMAFEHPRVSVADISGVIDARPAWAYMKFELGGLGRRIAPDGEISEGRA